MLVGAECIYFYHSCCRIDKYTYCNILCGKIITENWLYDTQKEKLGAMLDEDPSLMEKRNQIAKRLELYKQARDDIDSVAWK